MAGSGSSLHSAVGTGWVVGGCPPAEIPWDGRQVRGADLTGVCKDRNIILGGSALSAGQVLGLGVPSLGQGTFPGTPSHQQTLTKAGERNGEWVPTDGERWGVSTPSLGSPSWHSRLQGREAGREPQSQYPSAQLGAQGVSAEQGQREGGGEQQLLQWDRDQVLPPGCTAGPRVTMAGRVFFREK